MGAFGGISVLYFGVVYLAFLACWVDSRAEDNAAARSSMRFAGKTVALLGTILVRITPHAGRNAYATAGVPEFCGRW
jgi:hypothetical protein